MGAGSELLLPTHDDETVMDGAPGLLWLECKVSEARPGEPGDPWVVTLGPVMVRPVRPEGWPEA